MALDLGTLLDQTHTFVQDAQDAGNRVYGLFQDLSKSSDEDAKTQLDIGANNQIIEGARDSAAFATQKATIAGANALGGNLKDQSQLITGLSSNILDLMHQQDQATQVIKNKQSVGMFDDPITWAMNQITLPSDIAKHQAISQALSEKQNDLDYINKATTETARTQSLLGEPITQAGLTASQNNVANKAKLAASAANDEGLKYNVQGIQYALTVGKDILNSNFQEQSAKVASEHIALAQQQMDLERQRFSWQQEEKRIADEARQRGADIDAYTLSQINDGLKRMGQAEIPVTSLKAGQVMQLIKSNSPAAQDYIQALQVSRMSTTVGNGANIFATSPANAVDVLNGSVPIKLPAAVEPVKQLLAGASQKLAEYSRTPQGQLFNLKDPQQRAIAFNQFATAELQEKANNINYADKTNPFNIPDLRSLISASPEVQKLPLVQKVFAPALAAGADLADPDKQVHLIADALQKKIISYPEALEYTSIIQRGVTANIESRQFHALGLNLNPVEGSGDANMYSYRVPITTDQSGLFNSKRTVDLTKPDQFGRALNQTLANQNNPFKAGNTTISID